MSWSRPEWLGLLVLVPVLAWWARGSEQRRFVDWRRLGQRGAPLRTGALAGLLAQALLLVALAGPRWGTMAGSERPPGHDVVLVVDVSRSMAARDAVPNRLGLAIEAGHRLIEAVGREPGSRVGIVAFAGRGVKRCPLTENLGAAADTLARLRAGDIQPGGTDLRRALDVALSAFGPIEQESADSRTIVVLSDGEDHVGEWSAALPELKRAGVIVHCVAIGDPERGHPVPSTTTGALMYHGEPVLSCRQDAALAALADATGGALVRLGLSSPAGLTALYEERIRTVATAKREGARAPRRPERYSLFVIAALVANAIGAQPRRTPWALVLCLATLGPFVGAAGAQPESLDDAIAAGRGAFDRGDLEEALDAFQRAIVLGPGDPVPLHNAAVTMYELGRFDEARRRYEEAREQAGPALRMRIDFALGNTAFALGDVVGALAHYDDCLNARVVGPGLEALRHDAAVNRRYVQGAHRSASAPRGPDSPSRPDESAARPSSRDGAPKSRSDQSAPERPTTPEPIEAAPETAPSSPLDQALERARDARRFRLESPPPRATRDTDRKDW